MIGTKDPKTSHTFFLTSYIFVPTTKNLCQLTVRKNIKEYSLGRPWVHGYDSTIVGAWQHLRHTLGAKVGNDWLDGWGVMVIPY